MEGLKPPPDVLITHVCRLLLLCAGSCVLQRSESPVCSLDKVPQALACDWLLACLQVKTTNHQTAPCPDDSVPEFLPFCLFFSRNASFTRTHSRPCVSGWLMRLRLFVCFVLFFFFMTFFFFLWSNRIMLIIPNTSRPLFLLPPLSLLSHRFVAAIMEHFKRCFLVL